jgi:similar to spore coat protein
MQQSFALHETLELHEVSAFKSVCMTKSKTMQALVTDPELRELLQRDVQMSTRQLHELNGLLSKALAQGATI